MAFDKQTAVVVVASTGIGFMFDVFLYSLAQSEGKPFSLSMPRGRELFQLLAVEIVAGILIDFAIKQIEYGMMSDQERAMTALVEAEVYNIRTGKRQGVMPSAIQWEREPAQSVVIT